MGMLIDRESVERLMTLLASDYLKAREVVGDVKWLELPRNRRRCLVYGVDGSQGKRRLSGTILYIVSSVAFGSRPGYGMVYTNAMRYNHSFSDQIIRLQMETLENKVGYVAGKLEDVDIIMMDGTLTGSLTRPPAYPENVKGVNTIESLLGEERLAGLVRDFLDDLEDHYADLEDRMSRKRKIRGDVILADKDLEKFSDLYHDMAGRKVSDKEGPLTLEDARNAVHVVLGYIEYLYSLEKLLDMDLVYVAKSFYTRKITEKLGIDLLDVPYLDAYLRRIYGEEREGYTVITQGGSRLKHEVPKILRGHFKRVIGLLSNGVPMAYIRTMKGGIIYLLQSNRRIDDDLLERVLYHESNGYFRPLQRAHNSVKIDNRTFEREVDALLNMIKSEAPELTVFFKYGRTPLE